jgi:hypothetical protein
MTSTANCVSPANATSNTVYITVNPGITPSVSISANPVPPTCTGTNVTFSPLPVNGGNPSYEWFLNGNSVGTNSSFSTTALQNGDQVYCIMTSTATCANPATATSNSITMSVSAALTPSVNITANPASPICSGTNVTITPAPINGGSPTYQWYLNGSYVGSNTTFSSSNLTNGTTVFCIMHSTITCVNPANINSDTLTIVVNPLPGTPVVSQYGDSLYSSIPGGNQWLDGNQNIISGATGMSFWPPVDGTYYLMVTDTNGCSRISQPFSFVHVGIESNNQALKEVTLFPNPITGGKDMMISGIREKTSIAVFNLNGQLIINNILMQDGSVTLPNLAAALYIVRIMNDSGSIYRKLIVQ